MGPTFPTNNGWLGSVLAPNGTIYASPRFDPNTYQIQEIGISNRRHGCTLAPNGKIYFHPKPTPANAFVIVKTGYPQLQPWMMAPEFNKL